MWHSCRRKGILGGQDRRHLLWSGMAWDEKGEVQLNWKSRTMLQHCLALPYRVTCLAEPGTVPPILRQVWFLINTRHPIFSFQPLFFSESPMVVFRKQPQVSCLGFQGYTSYVDQLLGPVWLEKKKQTKQVLTLSSIQLSPEASKTTYFWRVAGESRGGAMTSENPPTTQA